MRFKTARPQQLGLLLLLMGGGNPAAQASLPPALAPFLKQHCLECHDADTKKGGLDLEALTTDLSKPEVMAGWIRIHDRVVAGEMPPKKKPAPAPDARIAFVSTVAKSLTASDMALKATVLRRLNRVEYEHTLHDLLGVRTELQELLPEDGKAFGFDNVGEALDLSAVHLQRYMEAAGAALMDAVHKGSPPEKETVIAAFERGLRGEGGLDRFKRSDGSIVFYGSGNFPLPLISPEFVTPADGDYLIRMTGQTVQSREPVMFSLLAGGGGKRAELHPVGLFEFPLSTTRLEAKVFLRVGERLRVHSRVSAVKQDFRKIVLADYKGPGFALQPFEIEGPITAEWPGYGHRLLFGELPATKVPSSGKEKKGKPNGKGKNKFDNSNVRLEILAKNPTADAKRLLAGFVPAAFRRPVTDDQIAPYVELVQSEMTGGSSFEAAMLTACTAVLCAPDFLYLKEPVGRLNDFALATRLSYMLWATAPDAELLALAQKGTLSQPAMLHAQTERLLNDPRASRFTTGFTGQWLGLREIDLTTPDQKLYPEFDDTLKAAMVKETESFFQEMLSKNLSVMNFIDSNWTMLNARLAEHYGISGVKGLECRKVALQPQQHRGGVLTHASVLKVTANGTTTSPVVRGAWVLDRIFGTPSPPPPPGVPGVEPDIRGATTLRQQLDKHRNLESCQGCHRLIDPPGFALENYDPMGAWRESYRILNADVSKRGFGPSSTKVVNWHSGPPVDAAGATAAGERFGNLSDYKRLQLARPEKFTHALAEKLAIYASGRGMGFSDRGELNAMTQKVMARGNGFRDLIHEVVQSDIFRNK